MKYLVKATVDSARLKDMVNAIYEEAMTGDQHFNPHVTWEPTDGAPRKPKLVHAPKVVEVKKHRRSAPHMLDRREALIEAMKGRTLRWSEMADALIAAGVKGSSTNRTIVSLRDDGRIKKIGPEGWRLVSPARTEPAKFEKAMERAKSNG